MPATPYFYAGHPFSVLSASPAADGVHIAITFPMDAAVPSAACVLTPEQFRVLLADGAAILADQERARRNPSLPLWPGLDG
ncbi:hypothetical protein [Saccharopolyspora sp. 6V]|uniref:hypothetical protein n=1 Tax=Saccharopolyspora sp. 6V TaxID=2877239 RepID=UPI001CD41238|nr:hypothetical protein [Saccharopolyspora sp. 6V]MCA1195343.1 hypothetical protein [Saccharopolyspora sp. 6V]